MVWATMVLPKGRYSMPPAKRPERVVPSIAAGSLLGDAIPVSSLREQHVKVCIYGRNRSGKTTLAAQFRKPLLLISTEPDACGGATSVADIDGVMLQRVSHKLLGQDRDGRWMDATDTACVRKDKLRGRDKLLGLAKELSYVHPFNTVVLDTATSLQDLIMAELMGWDRVPDILPSLGKGGKAMYMQRAEEWRASVSPLIDLATCDVVILAQEKDHNPLSDDFGGKAKILHTMQQGSFMAPSLGSTNAEWLQTRCGYVVQIYEDEVTREIIVPTADAQGNPTEPAIQRVGTGKRQRHLRLLYHPNFSAGGRWSYSKDVPEFVTAPSPAGLYAELSRYFMNSHGR
jgi:hypothetical protein